MDLFYIGVEFVRSPADVRESRLHLVRQCLSENHAKGLSWIQPVSEPEVDVDLALTSWLRPDAVGNRQPQCVFVHLYLTRDREIKNCHAPTFVDSVRANLHGTSDIERLGNLTGLTCPYTRGMTIGERLLNLSAEYQQAKGAAEWPQLAGQEPARAPEVIAADYESALRELLS